MGILGSIGIFRWFAMPGGQSFVTTGVLVVGVIFIGWWLRWDARADQTRAVVEKVVSKQKKQNQELLDKVSERNAELALAVKEARDELTINQGYNAELEVKLGQARQDVIERETRLAAALKRLDVKDQSHKCGLTQEELRLLNQ